MLEKVIHADAIASLPDGGSGGDAEALNGLPGEFYLDRGNHDGTQPIGSVAGLPEALGEKAPTIHTHVQADVDGLPEALAAKAPLSSPSFTDEPRAPTQSASDNSTLLATTAHVKAAIAASGGGGGGGGGDDAMTLNGQDGDYYRDRANHIGTQAIGTITGLGGELSLLRGAFQTRAALAAATVPAGLSSILLLGYAAAGDCPPAMLMRAAGINSGNAQSYHFPDAAGAYWIITGASFDPKQLGVKGDYTTNDSVAFQRCLDFFSATKMPCVAGPMNIGVVGSFDLPSGFRMRGVGPHDINTWLETNDKANLRPGYKHLIKGTNIILKGAATKTYTTNRTNNYQSMSYGLLYGHRERPMLEGIGIIQDMDVYNAGGAATSKATDNRSNYDVGLIMRCYSGRMTNVNIFGYWKSGTAGVQLSGKNGFVLHSQTSYDIVDSDYFMAMQCQFTGIAIIGSGSGDQGLTGSTWVSCQFYNGADHHVSADGDYTKPAIYIDGYLEPPAVTPPALPSLIYGIRGHSFVGGHLRTRNNEIIRLGYCDRVRFEFTASETPNVDGVTGADQQGKIIGTPAQTGKVYIGFSAISAGNSSWRIEEFASQCASLIALGGQGSDEILLTHRTAFRNSSGAETGSTVDGVRLFVNQVGDASMQLMGDPTSKTDGWVIQRDRSDGEALRFRFDNSLKMTIDASGNVTTSGTVNGGGGGGGSLAPTYDNVSLNASGYLRSLSGALELRGASGAGVTLKNGTTTIGSFAAGGDLTIYGSLWGTSGELNLRAASGNGVRLRNGSATILSIPPAGVYDTTTAGAANVVVTSSDVFARSTSSGRYKTDVETLGDDYRDLILSLRPVWYRSLCEADNPAWSYYGLIAEEVADIDPRLVHWRTTEKTYATVVDKVMVKAIDVVDGEEVETEIETEVEREVEVIAPLAEPVAEGVMYDRLVPHLIAKLQETEARLRLLEAESAARRAG